MNSRNSGFTLLELLVAIAVFALLAALAYGGLNAMMRTAQGTSEAREGLAQLQRGLRVLDEDMRYVIARGARDGLGAPQPAFASGSDGHALLDFTRSVRPREGFQPAPLERVRYWLDGATLVRQSWNPPDAARLEPDTELILWREVEAIRFDFLDASLQSRPAWPPPNVDTPGLPRAIELRLRLKDNEELRRLMVLPEFPAASGKTS